MFCQQCGTPLTDHAKFCNACGAPVQNRQEASYARPANPAAYPQPGQTPYSQPGQTPYPQTGQTPYSQTPYAQQAAYDRIPYAGTGKVRQGVPRPGYSDRADDPEILAALKKNRKAAWIFELIIAPLPLIGFMIYAGVTGDMEMPQAALYGGIVSAIFVLFALFSVFKTRASTAYEGVVIDQRTRERSQSNHNDTRSYYTEYITVVRTSDGKQKKIVEREGSRVWAYEYLNVGDHFRYHPKFAFPYELYDKMKAPCLYCVACQTQNPVEADRCARCNTPLLK